MGFLGKCNGVFAKHFSTILENFSEFFDEPEEIFAILRRHAEFFHEVLRPSRVRSPARTPLRKAFRFLLGRVRFPARTPLKKRLGFRWCLGLAGFDSLRGHVSYYHISSHLISPRLISSHPISTQLISSIYSDLEVIHGSNVIKALRFFRRRLILKDRDSY